MKLINTVWIRGKVLVSLFEDVEASTYFCSYWIGWRFYETRQYQLQDLAVDEAISDIYKKW